MILKIIYVLFFFFTHKQIYAGQHFTGSKQNVGSFLFIVGFINLIIEISFLIYNAINSHFIDSLILFVISIVCLFIFNAFTSKIGMKQALKYCNSDDPMFGGVYNHRCNVVSTIFALIGTIFNALSVIGYMIFLILENA